MVNAKTPWYILGVGSIGGLFARRLHTAGLPVTLLSRFGDAGHPPLTFVDEGQVTTLSLPSEPLMRIAGGETSGLEAIHQLLVCTKSYAAVDAITAIGPRLAPNATVVLLMNGMGVSDTLHKVQPNLTLIVGSTTAACYRDAQSRWHPVAAGETQLGWPTSGALSAPTAPAWFEDWQRGVPGLRWSPEMHPVQLAKLAVNAVINPATALWDVTNGALLTPPYRTQVMQACDEVAAVLAAAGEPALAASVTERVVAVAEATAANTSSMRADHLAGRATEVDAILGYLLETVKHRAARPPETPLLDAWLAALQHGVA